MPDLEQLFAALDRSSFRRGFHLAGDDAAYLRKRGLPAVMAHARGFVERRLAPAAPPKDGRQTPRRGHPVFVAQHATATCCRSCLSRWHGIPEDRPLTDAQIDHTLNVINRWLLRESRLHPADTANPLPSRRCSTEVR